MTGGTDEERSSRPPDTESRAALTIEELAAATGMTVRNVRAHQSRGLLPPPSVRGRVGFYGPDHVERLKLIRSMQDEGFNLAAIRSVLAAGDTTVDRLRRLRPAELDEYDVGPRAELSVDGVAELKRHGDLAIFLKAGLLRELGDGGYAATTPALLAAGRRLIALDIGPGQQTEAATMLVALANDAAELVAKVVDDLCGADCHDAAVLNGVRIWTTELYRAVLDHRIERHLEERYG